MKANYENRIDLNNNAGNHNSIYRGKDITDLFYDGTLSQQIAAGTFDDIYIGDYIIGQNSGRKYLVADINYYLHSGDTECTTNHVLMIPERTMGKAQMNNTDITTGAYKGSSMYSSNLNTFKTLIKNDFGTNHLLTHRQYFANSVLNGYENGGEWISSDIDLMNELMVYGSNVFHNIMNGNSVPSNQTIDKSQLSIFRLDKSKIIAFDDSNEREHWWLRDVTSSSQFTMVGSGGFCSPFNSSRTAGIRPAFLVY